VGQVEHLTRMVEVGEDCWGLVREHLGEQHERFGIVGLHTCGDLAPTSLRAMVASTNASYLCSVGCCYQRLTELHYSHPFLEQQQSRGSSSGFPLSSPLRSSSYWLGRSARMLACQPMARLAASTAPPSASLLWRAALQALLQTHAPHLTGQEAQVGRLAGRAASFPQYARLAATHLGAGLGQVSEEELAAWFEEQERRHGARLRAFHVFRSLLAPLVEAIVLVDRLVYLREQPGLHSCRLVRLFDPAVSPRAYAVIAERG